MKHVNIGLLGFGNIGTGTYRTLELNKERIKEREGLDLAITKILVRDPGKGRDILVDDDLFTTDPEEILADPTIDIVVEVMGGIEPATSYMLTAMEAGKSVVTANKAAVAANYELLMKAAEKNDVKMLFEASVGGAIPVLNAVSTALAANEFTEVLGIVNGTTNYILTKMTEEGADYAEVLKDAQDKGFAEADPTADVEGIDAANKLSILIALAFDTYVSPLDIPTTGITGVTKEDIEKAKAEGKKIKLIAKASKKNGFLEYSVAPTALPNEHPLAGVSNEFNAIYVTGNAADELMFYGRGAGPLPTGSAVMGDVITIAKAL